MEKNEKHLMEILFTHFIYVTICVHILANGFYICVEGFIASLSSFNANSFGENWEGGKRQLSERGLVPEINVQNCIGIEILWKLKCVLARMECRANIYGKCVKMRIIMEKSIYQMSSFIIGIVIIPSLCLLIKTIYSFNRMQID